MWQASDIYAEINQQLINEFSCSSLFGNKTYLVKNTNDYDWHHESVKHQMPVNGLIVVRDVIFENEDNFDDEDDTESQIFWDKNIVIPNPPDIIEPSGIISMSLFEFEAGELPPSNFLQFLKFLHLQTNSTIAYYFHQMWGGETEIEYAWIFAEEDEVLIFQDYASSYKITDNSQTIIGEGILKRLLKFLALELPTDFFALHTGTFDWRKWRVKCDELNNQ